MGQVPPVHSPQDVTPVPAQSAVAWLQRFSGVGLAGAVWGCLAWAAVSPGVSAWWALLPPALVPLVLGVQTALAHGVNRRAARLNGPTASPPITLAGSARAWWHEVPVSLRVFGWQQPWAWRAQPNARPPTTPPRRGVLLVHGYLCNRGLWGRWQAALHPRGHATVALNLEPVWGSIDDYAAAIDRAVCQLTEATGLPPLVVCHSMGGLAVRAWMRAAPGADTRVDHVVTIATPHQGTWLARWGQGINAGQMRLHSTWLTDLARAEPPSRSQRFTCWHSSGDNIVFPLGTAVLPGAQQRHVPDVGHVALVDHPAILAQVLQRLEPPA
jgi:hypothetical protein